MVATLAQDLVPEEDSEREAALVREEDPLVHGEAPVQEQAPVHGDPAEDEVARKAKAERQAKVDFAEPYMTVGQTVLLHAKHAGAVTTYADLDDPKFVVTSKPGTTGEQAVKEFLPQATYQPFDTELAAAMEVAEGRADAFVYDLPYTVTFSAMHAAADLVVLDQPFTTEPLAWAIRKDDPDFLKWLNGFLAELRQDGRYDKIHEKWFKSTDWFKYVR